MPSSSGASQAASHRYRTIFCLEDKLQFSGKLRAKKIYGRAIGGNNFFASKKEPYGTPSFKAATDMPTVNNQRALPSGLRDGPREVFPAKKLSPPIAAAKMQSLLKVFVFEQLEFSGEFIC